jgi:hypothetical protein
MGKLVSEKCLCGGVEFCDYGVKCVTVGVLHQLQKCVKCGVRRCTHKAHYERESDVLFAGKLGSNRTEDVVVQLNNISFNLLADSGGVFF